MASRRSIPSLDGLRAFSVALVILGHSDSAWTGHSRYYMDFLRDGHLGVATFFVISGFLITNLLLKEDAKRGEISLSNFYLRRAFRILPPFYAFLAVVAIRSLMHIDPVTPGSFFSAAFYIWNYNIHGTGNILGHLWSLCLEEQFYLFWPLCLVFFSKRTCLKIATVLVLISPFMRVFTYAVFPAYRGHIGMMLHTSIDTIMVGCILALAHDLKVWEKPLKRLASLPVCLGAAAFVLFINPILEEHFTGSWSLPFGMSARALCCASIILYAVDNPANLFGRLLNHPVMRHIGIISYSLYLWQQMFTFSEPYSQFPWNCLIILACAELSHYLVERPSYHVRDWVIARRKPAEPLAA